MKWYGWILLLMSFPALSRTITSPIYRVDYGHLPGDEILLFLSSGDVIKLPQFDLQVLEDFQTSKEENKWYSFKVDEKRVIKSFHPVKAPVVSSSIPKNFSPLNDYRMTTVKDFQTATRYIKESKRPVSDRVTQCFNRAMVWSYDWWKNHSLKSNKIFVFWTWDYTRESGHKWWFHVAPYIHVKNENGEVVERVLDVAWLKRPYAFQEWANYHTRAGDCKVVTKFSEHNQNQFGHNCYFQRAPNMYTWQPADLEMEEAWGYSKNAFIMEEVAAAHLEAFDITLTREGVE